LIWDYENWGVIVIYLESQQSHILLRYRLKIEKMRSNNRVELWARYCTLSNTQICTLFCLLMFICTTIIHNAMVLVSKNINLLFFLLLPWLIRYHTLKKYKLYIQIQ